MVGPRHDGLAAGLRDGRRDLLGVGRNHHAARPRRRIARRQTCTIIGSPWMSAIGLPGSRVACMRAGMTINVLVIGAALLSS